MNKNIKHELIQMGMSEAEINVLTKDEQFETILNYQGYIHCADWIKRLVKDVYGIDIK